MPGDLNLKKSWNPALMKNQKKIWEREQDALREHQAIKQRTKEIALEREKEEMIRMQYGNDLSKLPQKQKLELSKLGWMYTDMPNDNEDDGGFKEVEEDFLENTAQVEQLLHGNKPALQSMTSRFDKVASVGAGRAGASLTDDPLLLIRRQQQAQSSRRERSPSRGSSHGGKSDRSRGSYDRRERHTHRDPDGRSSKSDRHKSRVHKHHRSENRHDRNEPEGHHLDRKHRHESTNKPERVQSTSAHV